MAPRSVRRLLKMLPSQISKSPGYQIQVGLSFACIAFDVFVYVRSVVVPHVARAVGVLEKLFLGRPVGADSDVRRALVSVEIEPVIGIVDV